MPVPLDVIKALPWEVLAERTIECTYPDGTLRTVTLKLGKPQPAPEMDWLCFVDAEGLTNWTSPKVLFGVDAWQALFLAASFLIKQFRHHVRINGINLRWADTGAELSFDDAVSFPGLILEE